MEDGRYASRHETEDQQYYAQHICPHRQPALVIVPRNSLRFNPIFHIGLF